MSKRFKKLPEKTSELPAEGIEKLIPIIKKTTNTMKSLLSSNRSKAILGIGLIAIGIGAISKKVISYPTGGCMKDNQELTLNKRINKFII